MRIEIVTHCWRYERALAWQHDSLCRYRHECDVTLTICCVPEDAERLRARFLPDPRLTVAVVPLALPELLQRAIGRHRAARATEADVIWFADADYVFGPECLDTLARGNLSDGVLYWPRCCWKHLTHATGDEYLRSADRQCYELNADDFERVLQRPIGGVQIVTGATARSRGYCPEARWQAPPPTVDRMDCRSDVAFRRQFGRRVPLELPNLYRLRQTHSGQVDALPGVPAH